MLKFASRLRIDGLLIGLLPLLLAIPAGAQLPFFPLGAPAVRVDPPPPWLPGQVVRFEVIIDRFRAVERDAEGNITETQFFHGLALKWSDCWTDIQLGNPPPTRYTGEGFGGQWIAQVGGGPPARCKNLSRLVGFYFDGERTLGDERIPLDGDPSNNYGDGLREGPSLQGPWTFDWTARVRPCIGDSCSLNFLVYALSDGETGSWNRLPPGCDTGAQPPLIAASGQLKGKLQVTGAACTGQALEITCLAPDEAEQVRWQASGAEILEEEHCRLRLRWSESGAKVVIRHRLNQSRQIECSDTLRLDLREPFRPVFSLSSSRICGREAVKARLTGSEPTRWHWRAEPQAVQIADDDPRHMQFLWLEGGRGRIVLEAYDETCLTWTARSQEVLIDQPIEFTTLEINNRMICSGEPISVRAIIPEDVQITLTLPGAAVGSLAGAGPHQVLYTRAGEYGIIAQAQRGTCRRLALSTVRVLNRYAVSFEDPVRLCRPETLVIRSREALLDSSTTVSGLGVIAWEPTEGLIPLALGSLLVFPDTTTNYRILTSNGACFAETNLQVNVIPEIRIDGLPQEAERCLSGEAVQLQARVSGGMPPFSYHWVPSTNLSDPYGPVTKALPNRPTTYALEVIDSAGCRRSASTAINIREVQILGFKSQTNRCGPQSPAPELRVEVPTGADYSYQWLPPDGLSCSDCLRPTVLDTANRSYEVLLTDRQTGCTSRVGPIVFNFIQSLRAEAGAGARICEGSSVRLGTSIRQPVEVEYRWQPSTALDEPQSPTPLASPNQTTIFTLTVVATGCPPVEDTVRVEVIARPEFQVVAERRRFCAGDSVQLQIDGPTQIPGLRWQWHPGQGLSSDTAARPWAKPINTRTYELRLQGIECPPREPVLIELQVDPLPAIEVGSDSLLFCPEEAATGIELPARNLDDRIYLYQWEPTTGLEQPSNLTPRARPAAPTVYRLTATDATSGCQRRDSIWVGIGPMVQASVSWSDTTICRGDSVAIQVSGGVGSARYRWMPAQYASCSPCSNPHLKPNRSTTFTVTAEEAGCTSTASARVQVVPRPVVDFQPSPERGCAPLAVTMVEYGQDIRSWFWDFGDGNTGWGPSPRHVYHRAGRYRVRLAATGLNGACMLSEPEQERWVEVFESPRAGIVWNGQPQPMADGPPIRLRSTSSDSTGMCHWNLGDGRWAAGCEIWASWPDSGEFIIRLQVSDAAGCVDTASIRLRVAPAELSEIPSVFTPNSDGVNDIWQPVAQTGQGLSIWIYDRTGREIFSGNDDGWNGRYGDGREAPSGTYTYLIRWNGRWYRGWLVLLR